MFRSRNSLLLTLIVLALAAGVAAAKIGAGAIEADRTSDARATMFERARLIQSVLETGEPDNWDRFADAMGERAGLRVSIISKDGVVLGDSALALDQLSHLENHNDRPEVTVAAAGDTGFSVRYSATVADRLAYVAVPVNKGEARVLRLASPMSRITRDVLAAQIFVGAMAVGAFLLALFALVQMDRIRTARLSVLRHALKRSPKDARALFKDQSPEAALARTIEGALDFPSVELGEQKAEIDRQRRILQSMQEGVLVLDASGQIVLVNRSLREMLLLTDDVLDRPLHDVVRNTDLHALVDRTIDDGTPQSTEIETQGIKPRRLLVQASPLGDTSTGIVVVFVDVTEVRRLESLRRDFVANVSHELRTPVTAIRSAAETLRSSAINDPKMAAMFLDIVDRNAQRLGDLVEDLLDLSRIESKAYKLALEELSVAQVASYCLSLFRERADKKHLQLSMQVADDLPTIRADRRALEQVLTNLIDNAVKYCPDGREIAIAAEPSGNSIRITVRDSGQGIDEKHLPRLFERFYRVDPGRARESGGTGLGLSIAKHLVEAMGGTIGVESKPGKGTAFHVGMQRA